MHVYSEKNKNKFRKILRESLGREPTSDEIMRAICDDSKKNPTYYDGSSEEEIIEEIIEEPLTPKEEKLKAKYERILSTDLSIKQFRRHHEDEQNKKKEYELYKASIIKNKNDPCEEPEKPSKSIWDDEEDNKKEDDESYEEPKKVKTKSKAQTKKKEKVSSKKNLKPIKNEKCRITTHTKTSTLKKVKMSNPINCFMIEYIDSIDSKEEIHCIKTDKLYEQYTAKCKDPQDQNHFSRAIAKFCLTNVRCDNGIEKDRAHGKIRWTIHTELAKNWIERFQVAKD
jgi:hypothetical protein